jgi:hypothetical protein
MVFFLAGFFAASYGAPPLAAQYQGHSLGIGGEGNGVTLFKDLGLGAQFTVESRLNRFFAVDFHAIASSLFSRLSRITTEDSFLSFESLLYLRFYLFAPIDINMTGAEFFLAVGGGVISTLKGLDFHASRGSPEASAVLGVRFRPNLRFYLEPYIRVGWPSLMGMGLVAGFRVPSPYALTVPSAPPVDVPSTPPVDAASAPLPPDSGDPSALPPGAPSSNPPEVPAEDAPPEEERGPPRKSPRLFSR